MNGIRYRRTLFACLGILSVLPSAVFGSLTVRELDLPRTIFPESSYYLVDTDVEPGRENGFLRFHVRAVHGEYDVEGLAELRKLTKEIEVIEKIRRNQDGSGFVDGVASSIEQTTDGFVNLVTEPVRSVQGIGAAVGKLGGKIGGVFRHKEPGEKSSFTETVLGGSERELAKQFGVDVYTGNPTLRKMLHDMARARLGGKGAAAIGKLLIPVAGLVSVTLTASGINGAADNLVNDNSRGDLYELNEYALSALGFNLEEIKKFLNLSYYSPREFTYMRFYLEKLRGVEGFREILRRVIRSRSDWEARKILYEAQIAADSESPSFQSLEVFDEGLRVEAAGKIILITPYDYLDQDGLGRRVMKRALRIKAERPHKIFEIWNGGKVTLDFSTAALKEKINAQGWFLFHAQDGVV